MSAVTPHVHDQCVFHRREFEEPLVENQRRWHTLPQPVHGARQTATHQQQHRVKQLYSSELALAVYD